MIPIRNLYQMLLYAWNVLEEKDSADVGLAAETHPNDLLFLLLRAVCSKMIEKNLHREYSTQPELVTTVKGAINFSETMASGSLIRRALVCDVDGLRQDSVVNQIVRATISRALMANGLTSVSTEELELLHREFAFASDVRLTVSLFRRAKHLSTTRLHNLAIILCEMIFDSIIPVADGHGTRFVSFYEDDVRMRRLFENFVRNFLRYKFPSQKISGSSFKWNSVIASADVERLIPTLNTDITIFGEGLVKIVDTKFSKKMISDNRWGDSRFSTPHLYQMFAYLSNWQAKNNERVEGLLLYPSLRDELTFSATISGFPITWASVNLEADWSRIEARILELTVAT